MSECGDLILRVFHSNNLTYSSGMNFENLYEIIQKKNDPESMKIINMVNLTFTKLNEKFMKRICESLIESRSNINKEKKKKEIPKQKLENAIHEVNIKCLKCQNIQIQEFFTRTEQDQLLNSFPNSNDSFSSLREKDMRADLRYNDLKPYKTLYPNNEISLKYNYIFDKFI